VCCTGFPQIGGRVIRAAAVWAAIVLAPSVAVGQAIDAGAIFRVFLTDGRALPSYGEHAIVDDRLVFVLPVGVPGSHVELQLMSLPLSAIDVGRTSQYTEAMRARQYADTRGPAEYSAISAEVSETLAAIEKEPDSNRRLAMAEEARRRLTAWPRAHYGYRASEIGELASLFADVISDMRRLAGQSRFSLDLTAGPVLPTYPPPLPAPTRRESIEMALAAATVADVATDRPAILRAALLVLTDTPNEDALRGEVSRRLEEELAADAAYARLAVDLTALADRAMHRGDAKGIEAVLARLTLRDLALGSRRPQEVKALRERLDAMLRRARVHRLALDHWAAVGTSLFRYEREVRPVLSGLDGLEPVLNRIQDSKYLSFDRVLRTGAKLTSLRALLEAITPPQDLQVVHSTLLSALFMAHQACDRRRQADIAPNLSVAREAAAAAAGTLLLAARARQDLLALLSPPRFQ
jgi:hypothetical protein